MSGVRAASRRAGRADSLSHRPMDLSGIGRSVKPFGALKTLADIALRALNRLILFKIFKAIRIETVDPAFLTCDQKYRGLFLDGAMLMGLAADPQNELPLSFLDHALAKGD